MRLGRFIFAKALACESKSHIAHKVSCFGSYGFLKRVNRLACSSPALKNEPEIVVTGCKIGRAGDGFAECALGQLQFSGFHMTQAVAEIIVCRHK